MRLLAVIIFSIFYFSACTRPAESESPVKSKIVGAWQLTSYYTSIGGPGEWHDADPTNPAMIEFREDGALNYTPPSAEGGKKYQLTSDSTMLIIRTADTITYRYSVTEKELILHPPCIEGCSMKYKPVHSK
jgi:hypothetical protein